jgi:hypothetical protein
MITKVERDCPACGHTFGAVGSRSVCPNCHHRFDASPTHIALARKLGKCDANGLLRAIAAFHGVPCISSLDHPVCQTTAGNIPEIVAREYCVIPVLVDGEVRMAIPDPMIPGLAEVLTRLTGSSPKFAVACPDQVQDRINCLYGCVDVRSAVG